MSKPAFPKGRTERFMRATLSRGRVGKKAVAYTNAVVMAMASRLLQAASKEVVDAKRVRIAPRTLKLAIGHDEALTTIFGNHVIAKGGIIPLTDSALKDLGMKPKTKRKRKRKATTSRKTKTTTKKRKKRKKSKKSKKVRSRSRTRSRSRSRSPE